MRILFMGNNWVGLQVVRHIVEREDDIIGLVLHPSGEKHRDAIAATTNALDSTYPPPVFDGSKLNKRATREAIAALKPDIAVSVYFGYILGPKFIGLFPNGVANLHPSLLPHNRGANPNVWSIVDGEPSGVTLHYIDEGIDTGDIIAQRETPVCMNDTGETLYRRLERDAVDLFREHWPSVLDGTATRQTQPDTEGSFHLKSDTDGLDCLNLDARCRVGDLIDVLRARTFPPYPGAYFMHAGKRVHMRLVFEPEVE